MYVKLLSLPRLLGEQDRDRGDGWKRFCWNPSFTLSHPFPILHIPFHSLTSLCFSFQCKHSSLTWFQYESSNRICLTLTKVVNRLNEYSTEILNVSKATTRQSATVWYGINRRELIVVQRRFKKYNHKSTKTTALKRSGWYWLIFDWGVLLAHVSLFYHLSFKY